MNRRLSLQAICLALLLAATACDRGSSNLQTKEPVVDTAAVDTAAVETGQDTTATQRKAEDSDFLLDAYSYGLMLIRYSTQASEKARTPAVKSFAQQSAVWHKELNRELAQMASQQQVVLPDTVGADVEDYSARLQALPPAEFESRYLEVLRQIQQKTIGVYTRTAENAADSTVRKWAAQKVSDLQAHAQARQELSDQLKTE